MRIRLVTTVDHGGPLEHTLALAGELARQGDDVLVTCADERVASRFRAAGLDAVSAPVRGARDVAGARRMWRLVRDADVVHAQDRGAGLWVRLRSRPRGGQGIRAYTVHGLPTEYLPAPVGPPSPGLRAHIAYRGLDAALCRRAELVIVASRALASILAERVGFPRERLSVIPGGVELPLEAPAGGSLVGTVTTVKPVKGLDVFLRAAAVLAAERDELRFAVFGTGSQLEPLRALAHELGIAELMRFPGHVRAIEALAELRVFALTSWMENCPTALLEAMAAGVPAVATAVGGVPEIADGAVALVEPGDPAALAGEIERLVADRGLWERRAAAGRQRIAERFTIERTARETRAAYERALAA